MLRWHAAPDILVAAVRWKERCLLRDGSILSEGRVWTLENADQLDRYFVQQLDMGAGDFFEKLEIQLAAATPAAKQLAAEMLWLMLIFVSPSAMGGAAKRRAIRRIWEWSGEPFPGGNDSVGALLDHGVGSPGTAYQTGRWRELVFLIAAIRAWKKLPAGEQSKLAASGWDFAAWLDSVPESKARQFRDILLYLLFPDQFERIATGRDKRQVIERFRNELGGGKEVNYKDRIAVDRAVLQVRERLASQYGADSFDFYHQPVVELWKPKDAPIHADPPDQWVRETLGNARVWTIAAGEGGRLWPEFERGGFVAIGWDELGDLSLYGSQEEIRLALKAEGPDGPNPTNNALAVWQFVHDLKPGDHILVKRGRREILAHGIVTSGYDYQPDRVEYDNTRRVEWKRIGPWALTVDAKIAVKTLTEVTSYGDWLRRVWALMDTEGTPEPPIGPFPLEEALDGVFMSSDAFRGILDLLGRKRCVILEGPPGVGKTFLAKRIAFALMKQKDPARVEMVQFHQSYAYEDFVQGWRPTDDGKFAVQDGVFYRFCQQAKNRPNEPFVFIIDEINRANLSKVFGELMMLIEGDKRGAEFAIPLTYSRSDERFSVPPNLYILGLMNTADRSLAMVDYALRRRFGFIRLEPAFAAEAFADYMAEAGVDETLLARMIKSFRQLNETIRSDTANLGSGFEIGHSFFVPQDGASQLDEKWYTGVIRSEIEPLLREYWFDNPERVKQEVDRLLS